MPDLAPLVTRLAASRKYRDLHPAVLRRAAQDAALANDSLPAALKRAKSRLHQWFGAYRGVEWRRWLAALEATASVEALGIVEPSQLDTFVQRTALLHGSMSERRHELEAQLDWLLDRCAGAASVLDLGAGTMPLLLPACAAARGLELNYHGLEIDRALAEFGTRYLELRGMRGTVSFADALDSPPTAGAEVVLLLKGSPCLERQEPGATLRLIRAVPARSFILSFPTRSLGGREKGMRENYQAFAAALAADLGLSIESRAFESETFHRLFDSRRTA
jgi:16S rRNA (guanine(1405)-N(7))-methyltransferase